MRHFVTGAAALLLSVSIANGISWGAPHGGGGHGGGGGHMGGGGGHIGGGGGMHMGGGGGMHMGGGGMHMGGFSAGPAFHGGSSFGGSAFRAPSFSGPSFRAPSSLGGMRVSPGISSFRAPSMNLGSTMSPPLGNSLSRPNITGIRPNPGITNFRPNIGTNLGGRTAMNGQGQGGLRIGGSNPSLSGRNPGGIQGGARSAGLANTSLRVSGNNAGNGSLHVPFVGRVSPNQVGNFLSLSGRQGGLNSGSAVRGNQGLNVSHLAGHSNWHTLHTSQISHINNNVNVAFRNQAGFGTSHFGNSAFCNNWAGGVRGFCNFNRFNNCFTNRFWATNFCSFPWARSYYWWGARPWSYWWGCPTWAGLGGWFPYWGWNTPYYYGYGSGGNIVYSNGYVYMNGQPIATAEDYAASAADLATVPEPANPNQPTDWLPLGTFALSTGEDDKDPSRVMQLAVDKEGNISGTMTNQATNQTFPVLGRVDKETQRVAFTIGNSKDVVLETGIYNLTQQQTPVLAHGEGREETYLLLRLDAPKADDTKGTVPNASGKTLVP